MILDDHEIEDNWSRDRIVKDNLRVLFNTAISAYMSYQWVHGPRSFGRHLFYTFACAGYPFFVLDARTQRTMNSTGDDLTDNHLLGRPSLDPAEPGQLEILLHWLRETQQQLGDRPKFIVTASVFVPNPIDARTGRPGTPAQIASWAEASDAWPAFPLTRAKILECIVSAGVQNVVFLSGDIHCANVASMQITGSAAAEGLRLHNITSSAFYWPFPFADGEPSSYVHDSTADDQQDAFEFTVDGQRHRMHYRAWNFTQYDNFCRIDIDRGAGRIRVTAFGRDGEVLARYEPQVSPEEIAADLPAHLA
jgi:alkaline phosphatase D